MTDRDTGRPRGFGFVTFSDQRAVETAIREMHGQELGGRAISVNKAEPRVNSDSGYGNRGGSRGYSGGGGGGGSNECFKCGRTGHWARECPSGDTGRPKFDRYPDDRYDRYDGAEDRHDRYGGIDRYPASNGYGKEKGYGRDTGRYGVGGGGPSRYEGTGGNSYRDRPGPYDRPRRGGGPGSGTGGGYRERPGPYDRPSRGARAPAFDDRY